ncbi:hypothetical protein [Halodesulfovibrio marinisediminis]|uniref:Uncharacterized protein n=1 Tax=Halodesulfovibrio marinisediminis DSM 17456 TaxID=1121457 RepID=A0A1N6DQF8_9BACT|nr:hypothetical protein [Halodesulfovibrio marinisediminis]SIN73041.1 hypothetical protein SAMN02745161_0394 [Halodesulfovibrio marinisediminis DSM 17456]
MSDDARYVTIVSNSDVEDEVLMFTVNGQQIGIKSNIPHWLSEAEIEVIENAGWTVKETEDE